ncbi:DUF3833 domain-containing protein [Pelagibacteraceae bacterium]|jgi:hypothetical protein|nr:DUF3833 domain-containing protein [Pelagibacteraceae bacterium]MDC1148707.1 DUF3833 domain-containing protein [Pelagibacteraceae bacterium]|tara:strand:+ start:617 stop:1144 length:528 start_codon:yes stop_codon:yes gene_type:complete
MKKIIVILALILLTGCSTMNLEDYKDKKPILKLEEYFNGKSIARGVFEDRFGNIKKSFKVFIDGTWDGENLILKEDFIYDDGKKEYREWKLTKDKNNPNYYTGYADGVIGIASGSTSGNAFNWKYGFKLQVGERKINVKFDDWMFLQEDGYLINIAKVKKFGITLGRVILFFEKK